MLTIETIKAARDRISSRIHRTPVITSRLFNEVAGKQVFFKCENLQRAGAFKIRGATNKIQSLTPEEKQRGIVAFSSGNHAQAVALAGREAGVRVVVAMPDDAPKMKVAATRDYGAEIIFYDRHKEDREKFALGLAEQERLVMVPPYDDLLIIAGQATCGLEFLEDVPDLDCLLAPCSHGGLVLRWPRQRKMKSDIRLLPVGPLPQTTLANRTRRAKNYPFRRPNCRWSRVRIQALTFPIVQKLAEDVLTVSDEEILETIRFMLFRMKVLVEPSGVAAAAAVMLRKLPADVQKVGVVLSGGNIDGSVLSRVIAEA